MPTERRSELIKRNGGRFTGRQWRRLCALYGDRCLACGRREPDVHLTADHVVPLALGGRHAIRNLQPLCWPCNQEKGKAVVDYRESTLHGCTA